MGIVVSTGKTYKNAIVSVGKALTLSVMNDQHFWFFFL